MQYFDQLQDVMVRSGQLVMQYFRQEIQVSCKQDGSLVTNVDIENEKFLLRELAIIVPEAGFIAEESGRKNEQFDFMWVIDPLDGTKNFIKGIPYFCICVTLTLHGKPIVAAIYNPATKDLYYAEKGCGSWINGAQKLKMQENDFENKGVVVVVDENRLQRMKLQQEAQSLLRRVHISNRNFGSSGLQTAYIAAGYIDGMVFEDAPWWDVAAGMLLIQESGGFVSWQANSVDRMTKGTFVAGHPWICQQYFMIIDSKICN